MNPICVVQVVAARLLGCGWWAIVCNPARLPLYPIAICRFRKSTTAKCPVQGCGETITRNGLSPDREILQELKRAPDEVTSVPPTTGHLSLSLSRALSLAFFATHAFSLFCLSLSLSFKSIWSTASVTSVTA